MPSLFCVFGDIFDQHQERVAGHLIHLHIVGAEAFDSLGGALENLIAHCFTEGFVDRIKVVEIDK